MAGGVVTPMSTSLRNLILVCLFASPFLCYAQKNDPCVETMTFSNAESRDCYWKEQIAMNKLADDLAAHATTRLRGTSPKQKEIYGPVVLQALEDAARNLEDSQVSWHKFRDQYCDAVKFSYTTGSGAGTAMEECLYTTALARVRQLQRDFPEESHHKEHRQ
jgi:Lysozyme inhibitor LprI